MKRNTKMKVKLKKRGLTMSKIEYLELSAVSTEKVISGYQHEYV